MPTTEQGLPRVSASSSTSASDISDRHEFVSQSYEDARAGRISLSKGVGYVFLISSVVGIATFGLGYSLVRRKASVHVLPPGEEPPARVGARALFWGTLFAVTGCGTVGLAIYKVAQLCGFRMVRLL